MISDSKKKKESKESIVAAKHPHHIISMHAGPEKFLAFSSFFLAITCMNPHVITSRSRGVLPVLHLYIRRGELGHRHPENCLYGGETQVNKQRGLQPGSLNHCHYH